MPRRPCVHSITCGLRATVAVAVAVAIAVSVGMAVTVTVTTAVAGATTAGPGTHRPHSPALVADLPLLMPAVWPAGAAGYWQWDWTYQFPGRAWRWEPWHEGHRNAATALGLDPDLVTGRGDAAAVEREQLRAATAELAQTWPHPRFRTGATDLVLPLAPPAAPPRAVVVLRGSGATGGSLYLLERQPAGWHSESLQMLAYTTLARDLDGDGRPEIIAAHKVGSGQNLAIAVFRWDQQRVRRVALIGHSYAGPFGLCDCDQDGRVELWVDAGADRGLFTLYPPATGPDLWDRIVYRWQQGTYRPARRYRLATPFHHLNRYLYLAARGEWTAAARHTEPGARIDRALVAGLGLGPFHGGNDAPFVNGRMYFNTRAADFYADFGPTGRLLHLGRGSPGLAQEAG